MSAGLDPRACFDTSATTDGEVSYHLPSTPTVAGSRWVKFFVWQLETTGSSGYLFFYSFAIFSFLHYRYVPP